MLNLLPRFAPSPSKSSDSLPSGLSAELPLALQTFANTQPTLARIYAGRGIESLEELDTSVSCLLPAEDLLGIDKAVNLLDKALDSGKRILIVGDFDCDGATSTALMMRVLSAMGETTGAKIDFIVPDRFKYGYGLTPEIVELGIDSYQPELIVTVDNGISSHDGVATAQQHGIEVIITDHHLTTKATPNAEAVVNPNQLGCSFASKSLVGVGVAFYLLGRLAKVRRLAGKSSYQVSRHLDLVALGTIADVGILDHNNRILVYHGLQAIRSGKCSLGILAILEQAGRDCAKLNTQDLGFVLAPRINAAGRMDNMSIGIECLLTDDWGVAQSLAYRLDKLNKERRAVEGRMREEADSILQQHLLQQNASQQHCLEQKDGQNLSVKNLESLEDLKSSENLDNPVSLENPERLANDNSHPINRRCILLYQDDWHQGVIGIVAGRLKESYYCPAIVFAPADNTASNDDDLIKGSARSIAGIHIRDAIEQVAEQHPELISHFGGHAMAAGLTLKRKNFVAFSQAFQSVMEAFDEQLFQEQKFTDGQLVAEDFSLQFVEMLQQANIWGHGFVAPIFDGVFELLSFRVLKDKHLKLSLKYPDVQYPIDAICFNYDASVWDYRASKVHLLFELDINEWNGSQSLQLIVRDFAVVECVANV